MPHFRFSRVVIAFCFVLLFLNLPFSAGQDVPATTTETEAAESNSSDPYKISVDVREIRLDVVVVDGRGRPITDLTADDFEIYQDKLPQEVTSGIYIENQTEAAAQPSAARKDSLNFQQQRLQLPATALKNEEEVKRTIIFVVDNLAGAGYWGKMSIKRFLEKQMQPGDLVAVMHTMHGNSAMNFFSSDKRLITARVDSIPILPGLMEDEDAYSEHRLTRIYNRQFSILNYCIHAMKDMPGRKHIFFLTPATTMPTEMSDTLRLVDLGREVSIFDNPAENYHQRFGNAFDRLADDALRAGIVVHTLDTGGLSVGGNNSIYAEGMSLSTLAERTGGIYLTNNNFFLDGIGRDANNMIAGYYLVSYVPPPDTFDPDRKSVYNRVEVKVKRKGATVYTRDGFYGRTESEADSIAPPAYPLEDAVFSPFQHAELGVSMTAGYAKDAKAGYIVRSWIHLAPENITIVETEDGGARIDLEAVCLTSESDIRGNVQDFKQVKYTFNIQPEKKSENIAWFQEHGIRFSVLLPVKKPGFYTVRIAIQDVESGKTGSAWQSVEIPDLKKSGLALSDIFIITSAEDIAWMRSDVTKEIATGLFYPVMSKDEGRSPALRTYMPEDRFHTMTMLYNADARAINRSEIEMQSFIYKDGVEFMRGEAMTVTAQGKAENIEGIQVLRKFTMGSDMPPGDYLLQMLATDKKNSEKKDSIEKEGLFSKIARSYLGTERNYNTKGATSKTLSFTVAE
jgi:VWFA-related protein